MTMLASSFPSVLVAEQDTSFPVAPRQFLKNQTFANLTRDHQAIKVPCEYMWWWICFNLADKVHIPTLHHCSFVKHCQRNSWLVPQPQPGHGLHWSLADMVCHQAEN